MQKYILLCVLASMPLFAMEEDCEISQQKKDIVKVFSIVKSRWDKVTKKDTERPSEEFYGDQIIKEYKRRKFSRIIHEVYGAPKEVLNNPKKATDFYRKQDITSENYHKEIGFVYTPEQFVDDLPPALVTQVYNMCVRVQAMESYCRECEAKNHQVYIERST